MGGEKCVLFSGVVAERWYFFTDSVFGRGKVCPFFWGGSGALVFLHGFSVWEGKTVSFLLGGSGALVFLHGFRVWEGKTVSFFLGV